MAIEEVPALLALERSLRRKSEYIAVHDVGPGAQPMVVEMASVVAVLTCIDLILHLPPHYHELKLLFTRRRDGAPEDDDSGPTHEPDLDELAERLVAGDVDAEQVVEQMCRLVAPGSPAWRQVLEISTSSGALLTSLQERGLPKFVAQQVINEVRRSL